MVGFSVFLVLLIALGCGLYFSMVMDEREEAATGTPFAEGEVRFPAFARTRDKGGSLCKEIVLLLRKRDDLGKIWKQGALMRGSTVIGAADRWFQAVCREKNVYAAALLAALCRLCPEELPEDEADFWHGGVLRLLDTGEGYFLLGLSSLYLYVSFCAHDETVAGAIFYPWRDRMDDVPLQMIPYFVTCHVNCHTVLNYIDAAQSIGLPGDPCPMCQAEAGLSILDDMPDYFPFLVTSNEACDGSVGTSILQDWAYDKPLFAMPQPMQFDDPLVQKHCRREIEECWKFIEEQTGMPMNWDVFVEYIEKYNQLTLFEREKWDVAANTPYYPINGVGQALYRIYYSQDGYRDIWAQTDKKVKKIMYRCVEKKIETFPETRHRVLAWSCAPLYYSHWCTWAYNCWGLNTIMNMDSLMFDIVMRTDTKEHLMEDFTLYNEWAPMRRMAVGGYKHIFEIWENMERFNCDMVMMYDQVQCKGMQGITGMFEDEFRKRNIHAIWMPHALPDSRTVSRMEIRRIVNDYMFTVMHEEPLDPTLLEFDDSMSW